MLHAGPVWDFDIALGNHDVEHLAGIPTADYDKNIIFYRYPRGTNWFPELPE